MVRKLGVSCLSLVVGVALLLSVQGRAHAEEAPAVMLNSNLPVSGYHFGSEGQYSVGPFVVYHFISPATP